MKICNIGKHLLKRNIDHYWHFITKINVFLSQFLMFQVSTFSKLQRIESFSQRKHKRFHRTSVSRLSLTRPKGWRRLQFDRTGNSEYNKRAIRHTFLCFSCAHNFFRAQFHMSESKSAFRISRRFPRSAGSQTFFARVAQSFCIFSQRLLAFGARRIGHIRRG